MMMKQAYSILALLALAVAFNSAAVAQVQTKADHFRCYAIPPKVLDEKVELLDQFDAGKPETPEKFERRFFCNPVQKSIDGKVVGQLYHPTYHLTMYKFTPEQTKIPPIQIKNQFFTGRILLGPAEILAIPTGKSESPNLKPPNPPIGLDHYKCYGVENPSPHFPTIQLKDQFSENKVNVLRLLYFCSPAAKKHGTTTTHILNPREHLACYATQDPGVLRPVGIRNQFETAQLTEGKAELLCVPSVLVQPAIGKAGPK